jgi:transcriptional repressor NrdR
MNCPFCTSADTQVIDSRVSEAGDSIRRRRRCMACQKRFTTYENAELRLPQVVKADGSRADFDEGKIRVGFQRALHKRPVPTEYVDAAIKRIVQHVLSLGEREIPARDIGERLGSGGPGHRDENHERAKKPGHAGHHLSVVSA